MQIMSIALCAIGVMRCQVWLSDTSDTSMFLEISGIKNISLETVGVGNLACVLRI